VWVRGEKYPLPQKRKTGTHALHLARKPEGGEEKHRVDRTLYLLFTYRYSTRKGEL